MSVPHLPSAAEATLRNRKVFCGFSGGSDSLYLLLALKSLSEPLSFSLEAIHFEHGLRGAESVADAEWCREKCRKEGIPVRMISLSVPERIRPGEGTEAAARRLRLDAWKHLSEVVPGALIVLGHHGGDRVENLFLRLFRGSNATGLSSMRFHSFLNGMEILRPLLSFSKEEMESVLRESGETWRLDSSNESEEYLRNFLRRNIFPAVFNKIPYACKGVLHSAAVLETDADFLEQSARSEYQHMRSSEDFSPGRWALLHPAMLCRVLRLFLHDCSGTDLIPDQSLIRRFVQAVHSPPLDGSCIRVELKDEASAFLCVEANRVFWLGTHSLLSPVEWHWKENPVIRYGTRILRMEQVRGVDLSAGKTTAYFGNDLPDVLILSIRKDGDRMIPFGAHAPVLLKKLYSDAHIRSYDRNNQPVIRDSAGTILWVPGVKHSAMYPVSNSDGECFRITADDPEFHRAL